MRPNYTGVFSALIMIIGCAIAYMNAQAQNNGAALSGQAINGLISNKSLIGKTKGRIWKNYYLPSGHIHYSDNTGKTANGYWRVEKDLYCDNWPSSSQWECYILFLKGNKVVFKSTSSSKTFQASLSH